MASQKCRLILLTGPKHSGKTTFVQKLAHRLKKENFRIAGFIAPSIYQGTFLLGFDLVDIQSGQAVKFARRKSATDTYELSEEGFLFGRKILESKETRNADLIIIDEFGPLELEGDGWRKNIDSLLEDKKCLLLVVREELVETVERLFSNLNCRKFNSIENSFEKIILLLKNRERNVDKEKIFEEINKRSKDGQISCKQCFEVAQCCEVSLKEVGRTCNEKNIKIRFCQLGCFE